MKYLGKIKLAVGYWMIWLMIFQLSRFVFIIYNHSLSPQTTTADLFAAALNGGRMDMAMASYLLVPVCIFLMLSCFSGIFQQSGPYLLYTRILLIPVILITTSDLPAYAAWGFRLDSSPLKYLNNPKEAWASMGHLPLTAILLSILISFAVFSRLFGLYFKKNESHLSAQGKWVVSEIIILLLFTAGQIIPIRGGLQLAPLNQSSVYFSRDHFANICALNATWNFMRSVSAQGNVDENPFEYLSVDEMEKYWAEVQRANTDSNQKVVSNITHPNILLITWESLTSKALFQSVSGTRVLPCLERRMQEGIWFENAYASGDRTDKGIVAILSGYPAQPITSIVKMPEKTRSLSCLPACLQQSGYSTSFYYGGETEFANMKTYLLGAGFDRITDVNTFEEEDRNSKWGAHDHIVKERIIKELSPGKQPFFLHWLTLSSHEPFETGSKQVIHGNDDLSKFMNSLHYTDSVVDKLIDYCSRQPWWKETIVLISGDHGHRLPATGSKQDDFRTPILLLGGALQGKTARIPNIVSQTGIAAAICSLTGSRGDFPFSNNILSNQKTPYAYFCFNNGFGYTQQEATVIYDNIGRMIIERMGTFDSALLKRGMAIQQKSFGDYLNR